MDALLMRRKERVKGSVKIDEVTVCDNLRLRIEKNGEEGGKPAASKSNRRREWMVCRRGDEEGWSACERRTDAEKGRTRNATVQANCW